MIKIICTIEILGMGTSFGILKDDSIKLIRLQSIQKQENC